MDKDAFLNLLVTQLQNQDPLNPTDSVEFTAQLAQFSSLEQLSNVNDNLEQLQNYQASINNSQAVSLIGKDITAKGNALQLKDGGPAGCNFSLDGSAAIVTISLYDSTGEFVMILERTPNQYEKLNIESHQWTLDLLVEYVHAYHGISVCRSSVYHSFRKTGRRTGRSKLRVGSPDPEYVVKRQHVEVVKNLSEGGN